MTDTPPCWYCLEPANLAGDQVLFGISEFLTAVAIVAAAYTLSDERYKFRIAVSRIPLPRMFLWCTVVVGVLVAATAFWFQLSFPIPHALNQRLYFDAVFASIFLVLICYWLLVSFVSRPVFGRSNGLRYGRRLLETIQDGDAVALGAVASEVGHSARNIVEIARRRTLRRNLGNGGFKQVVPDEARIANDVVLLLGNRKFCRAVATKHPWVAAEFYSQIARGPLGSIPFAQFARNVVAELLGDTDSAIYHEDDGFHSGLLGYAKPISRELFGHHELIEELAAGHGSPLDPMWIQTSSWGAENWRAYSRIVLMFFDAKFADYRQEHSYAMAQIMSVFEHLCSDAYELNDVGDKFYELLAYEKIKLTVDFINDFVSLLDKYEIDFRYPEDKYSNPYDIISRVSLGTLLNISSIRTKEWANWQVQFNIFWSNIFPRYSEPSVRRHEFERRFKKLIWNEVKEMDKYFNYAGARYISVCLNVMGPDEGHEVHRPKSYRALKRLVLRWTAKNYLRMREELPAVAEVCLGGTISFDIDGKRLVKTYASGLKKEPDREYLALLG